MKPTRDRGRHPAHLVMTLLTVAALGLPAAAVNPAEAAEGPSYPAVYSSEQILADFDLFERAMREAHSGLFVFRTPDEIDRAFEEAREQLRAASTEHELYLAMSYVVAEIQDGHTSAMLSQAAQRYMFAQPAFLPFKLGFVDGRAVLHRDYTEGASDLLGLEVAAINGTPMERVLAEMKSYVRSDGSNETGKLRDLESTVGFGRLYQALYGPTPEFDLELVSAEGGTRTVTVAAIPEEVLNARFESRYAELSEVPQFELTFLEPPASTAIVRIAQFTGDELPGFIDDAFHQFADRGTKNLIVDLRGNGGGIEAYGQRLVSYLVTEPFDFYDRVVVNKRRFDTQAFSNHPDLYYEDDEVVPGPDGKFLIKESHYDFIAEQQPRGPHFGGTVHVLIDGGSFSTTTDTCTALDQHTDAVFVGEEAGGSYYGNTSGSNITITLPHTKARARIPLERFYATATGYEPADRGLIPDHQASLTPSDLVDGNDSVLEHTLTLIQQASIE